MPPGPPPPPPPGQPNVAVAAAEAKKRLEAKLAEKERKAAEQAAAQLAEEQAQAARWLNPAPLELVADEPTKLPASVIVNSEKYYVTEFLGGGSHGEVFAGCKASEVEGEIGTAEFAASLKSQNSNKAEYAIRYDKDNRPVEEHAKLAQQQIGHYRADEGRIQVQLNLSAKNMVSLKDYIGTHPGQVTKEWVKERMVESLQALERDFPGQTHGDFHPGNIMVDKDTGKVTCVIDFGDLEPGPHTFENSPWKDVPVSDVNREFRQIYLATNSANREARKSNAVEHSLKLQAGDYDVSQESVDRMKADFVESACNRPLNPSNITDPVLRMQCTVHKQFNQQISSDFAVIAHNELFELKQISDGNVDAIEACKAKYLGQRLDLCRAYEAGTQEIGSYNTAREWLEADNIQTGGSNSVNVKKVLNAVPPGALESNGQQLQRVAANETATDVTHGRDIEM